MVNASQFASLQQQHQIKQDQQQQPAAAVDNGRVNRMEIKTKKGATLDAAVRSYLSDIGSAWPLCTWIQTFQAASQHLAEMF